ncbi:hypothetical protein GCM10011380_00150 [Sphingomonas metalli]|uniref:DUF2497 domain-containing protein n=1 Tax=Sphingomonas metalli TaxID=1779358 RepID=A0A916WNK0_9SPHN|nr:DUF2497 domain-containing protein [Sphingomonas metalli]GGB14722.1 hypothetical protein GCM10011380_00150 [Sphingomonas metalli]
MGDMSAEPSMEEILSSIKRIIAEEGEGPVRARRAPRTAPPAPPAAPVEADDEGEVLELSDPILPVPAEVSPPVVVDDDIAEEVEEQEPVMADSHVADPAPAVRAAAPSPAAGSILSAGAAEASRNALDNLSRLIVRAESPSSPKADDNTLEGLVRAMLRPMLAEWLDTHLPAMVEEMVAAEIAKITRAPR